MFASAARRKARTASTHATNRKYAKPASRIASDALASTISARNGAIQKSASVTGVTRKILHATNTARCWLRNAAADHNRYWNRPILPLNEKENAMVTVSLVEALQGPAA